MEHIDLMHGRLALPAFFPDGTYGVVKAVDSADLIHVNVPGIVMNAYHLQSKPGVSVLKKHGGIHRFAGWDRPVLTDSGGFQVYSLLRENKKYGQIRGDGILFRPDMGDKKLFFSPEKCLQLQFAARSDIMMCLDLCTHPDDPPAMQEASVDATIRWARQSKAEYEQLLRSYKYADGEKPLLFAIIQGGNDIALRQRCAEALCEIGFAGYGFGGWPLDGEGRLMDDILALTARLMPQGSVKYAMGVGKPEEIVRCHKMGYTLFDCVIPTREARHHRLYVFNDARDINLDDSPFYSYLYIMDERHAADTRPVSDGCDCPLCQNYSRGYLRHLFKLNDSLALRLATLHNLRFYTMLMERLGHG